MADAVQERILRAIEGRTLCGLFLDTCRDHASSTALIDRDGSTVRKRTWSDYRRLASQVAMGLRALGVDHTDRVGLMMLNRPEHVIADTGAMLAGATPLSIYNTLTGDQVAYIAKDAAVKVAIVDAEFADVWRSIRGDVPSLETLVVLDGDASGEGETTFADLLASGSDALATGEGAFENAWRAVEPDDIATVIYTSGTTGPPKGVQITHRGLLYQLWALEDVIDPQKGIRGVSYLPLAHIAERMLTHYLGMKEAAQVEYVPDVKQILPALVGNRPEVFLAVPRVWEKMQSRILAALDEQDERRRKLVLKAIDTSRDVIRKQQAKQPVPFLDGLKHKLFDRVVHAKIRDQLGLDQLQYAISGAAPISAELQIFFAAIGIEILEAYGMTESTAVISSTRPGTARFGTVGQPVPGTEVVLAEDGEVLARGPHVTPGYLNRDDATAEAIDEDGWLHTGDLGAFDEDGNLRIIGRKKELIVTAGGKNLSPNNIEELIKPQSELIAQVCAVGDDRPYIAALVVLDAEVLPGWCEAHGIAYESMAQAVEQPEVVAEVERAIQAGNAKLARVEQVKQWTLLPAEWTPESEEMTPTMKLKRRVIHSKYSDVIDSMYTS